MLTFDHVTTTMADFDYATTTMADFDYATTMADFELDPADEAPPAGDVLPALSRISIYIGIGI